MTRPISITETRTITITMTPDEAASLIVHSYGELREKIIAALRTSAPDTLAAHERYQELRARNGW